jgi:hypothetical protein
MPTKRKFDDFRSEVAEDKDASSHLLQNHYFTYYELQLAWIILWWKFEDRYIKGGIRDKRSVNETNKLLVEASRLCAFMMFATTIPMRVSCFSDLTMEKITYIDTGGCDEGQYKIEVTSMFHPNFVTTLSRCVTGIISFLHALHKESNIPKTSCMLLCKKGNQDKCTLRKMNSSDFGNCITDCMRNVYPDREKYPNNTDFRRIYNTWFEKLYMKPDKFDACLILALDTYKKLCAKQTPGLRVWCAQLSHTAFAQHNTYVSVALREERKNNMFSRVMDHYYECFTNKRGEHEQQFRMEIVCVNDTYTSNKLR